VENTHEEEEERQPLQLTTVVKRPSLEYELTSRQEDNSPMEDLSLRTSFVLGSGRRQDRHVDIVDNEIILASNRSPFRNITFTLNRWANPIAALNDIDTVVRRLNTTDENGRRSLVCRRHLGDGYYIRLLCSLRCVDFRKYFIPYGYKFSQVRPSSNGITLHFDEWKDLLEVIIPSINERSHSLPTLNNVHMTTIIQHN